MRRLISRPLLSLLAAGFAGLGAPLACFAGETTEITSISSLCAEGSTLFGGSGHVDGAACGNVTAEPFYYFDADYLFWSRDSGSSSRTIIGGPEALSSVGFGSDFESGVRLRAGAAFENFELQFSWSKIGNWKELQSGRLTNGIAFDTGGSFAGANFINDTTAFQSLFAAAEFNPGGGPDETQEDDGLGPVGAFTDPPPQYTVYANSELHDFELISKFAHITSRIKFGVGWRHVDLDESMGAVLSGTFRAIDTGGGANGGLSHAALTDSNGGNLTLLSGAADGFDDETALLGAAGPDLLRLHEQAATQNSLDGVQFSLDLLVMESQNFLVDTILKAGVYNNSASGSFQENYAGVGNDNSVYGRSLSDSGNSVAFVGQVGLGTMYRVTDHIRFRFGWDVLFLSGVALAPEQTAVANSYTLNNDGSVVVHGGHVGWEFVY